MFISHVSVEVELLKLSESAEAQKAEDLFAKVVAEVTVGPNLLEGSAVFYAGSGRRVFNLINIAFT